MIYQYTHCLPIVEISLYHAEHEITIAAAVDCGSMVSVLPYDLGLQLGFIWEEQIKPLTLAGIYKDVPAYGVLVRGKIPGLPAKALTFAWIAKPSPEARPLLGYMNFFQQFRVVLEAYENRFEITPKGKKEGE